MKLPKNNQPVMVDCKDGRLEYGRFYQRSSLGVPAFEVRVPGGNMLYTPDKVRSWRPLSEQELKQYGLK